MHIHSNASAHIAIADHGAYLAAVARAEQRALHSFFDQHVLEEDDGAFVTVDEGDYGNLPTRLIDRIVYTAAGAMSDYD